MKRNVILNSFCKGLLLLVMSTISWVAADAAQPQTKDKETRSNIILIMAYKRAAQ